MAEVKILEVRDRATFIPMLAIKLSPVNEPERYLAARSGYGTAAEDQKDFILMAALCGGENLNYNPHSWGNRTRQVAHGWLLENWDHVQTGDVIDVEYVLHETDKPKVSERIEQ